MKYNVARDFIAAGYLLRCETWNSDEYIALASGGDLVFEDGRNYTSLGLSPIAAESLAKANKEGIPVHITPYLVKFDGPCTAVYDYSLSTKELFIDDWGIFNGEFTDFLLWKPGSMIKKDDLVGRIMQYDPIAGLVATDAIERRNVGVYPIFALYHEGWRLVIDKKKMS